MFFKDPVVGKMNVPELYHFYQAVILNLSNGILFTFNCPQFVGQAARQTSNVIEWSLTLETCLT